MCRAGRTPVRLFHLALRMVRGFDLLDFLKREQQLIFRQGLSPTAEAMTLQFLDDLTQPLALGSLGHEHRLEQVRIIRERGHRAGHEGK
jgi:hypothetical protein